MNWTKCLLAAGLVGLGSPALAQVGGFSGMEFVDAVRDGDDNKAVQLLTVTPAVIDARNGKGETALFVAVVDRDADWTGFLIRKGADPNLASRSGSGDTPLIAAARIGFVDAVDWLIGARAEVDGANRMGETALNVAVQARQREVVRALLNAGADPDKTDTAAGLSPRDYAKRDPRAREILRLIETRMPASSPD